MTVNKKIEQVIARGGEVSPEGKQEKLWHLVTQKIRMDMLKEIDAAVKERPGMNRSTWILEALQEKIKRLKDVQ